MSKSSHIMKARSWLGRIWHGNGLTYIIRVSEISPLAAETSPLMLEMFRPAPQQFSSHLQSLVWIYYYGSLTR